MEIQKRFMLLLYSVLYFLTVYNVYGRNENNANEYLDKVIENNLKTKSNHEAVDNFHLIDKLILTESRIRFTSGQMLGTLDMEKIKNCNDYSPVIRKCNFDFDQIIILYDGIFENNGYISHNFNVEVNFNNVNVYAEINYLNSFHNPEISKLDIVKKDPAVINLYKFPNLGEDFQNMVKSNLINKLENGFESILAKYIVSDVLPRVDNSPPFTTPYFYNPFENIDLDSIIKN